MNHWIQQDKLQMWTDNIDFIIAATLKDVSIILLGLGMIYERDMWYAMSSSQNFTYDMDGIVTKKTIQEWIDQCGEGYFGSTEY